MRRYDSIITIAASYFDKENYLASAQEYNKAFKLLNNKGRAIDRYNAAKACAMAERPDSSFCHLFKISKVPCFLKLRKNELFNLASFGNLRSLPSWKLLMDSIDYYSQDIIAI